MPRGGAAAEPSLYCYSVRQTKIVATIGPASCDRAVVEALVAAGVNVFRLNFSHGTQRTHRATLETIREVAAQSRRPVGILQDLSGPKIRTGELEGGQPIALAPGDELEIRIGSLAGRRGLVSTTYAPLAAAVKPGDRLLLDDGKIELVVEAASADSIRREWSMAARSVQHKGINAPNVPLPSVGVTARDEDGSALRLVDRCRSGRAQLRAVGRRHRAGTGDRRRRRPPAGTDHREARAP